MSRGQIAQELNDLAAQHNGLLKAEDVVRYAEQHPDSACHQWFTWDNEEAAHQHRLNEARSLIRVHVRVEELPQSHSKVTVREYVSLSSDRVNGGGYRKLDEVVSNGDLLAELLTDALRDLERFKKRYEHLNELRGVFEAINQVAEARPGAATRG